MCMEGVPEEGDKKTWKSFEVCWVLVYAREKGEVLCSVIRYQ